MGHYLELVELEQIRISFIAKGGEESSLEGPHFPADGHLGQLGLARLQHSQTLLLWLLCCPRCVVLVERELKNKGVNHYRPYGDRI